MEKEAKKRGRKKGYVSPKPKLVALNARIPESDMQALKSLSKSKFGTLENISLIVREIIQAHLTGEKKRKTSSPSTQENTMLFAC